LIRLSWVVFLHAALLSIESIVIEMLTAQLQLEPLVIAANSIPVAGAALLLITLGLEKKKQAFAVFRQWKYLLSGSVLLAIGVFAWYDSVRNVRASKEGLLAGPLETIVILFLARVALQEKLNRAQLAGVMIALGGFFATVMSAGNAQLLITWGDIEAVLSAVAFGSGIIFITKLAKTYSALQITGSSLFTSGIVLAVVLWTTSAPAIQLPDWTVLALFSLLPLSAALTYVIGLSRIGASLNSTIASFSILLTVVFQLALLALDVQVILPANIPLAVAGGALGVFGIYLIHRTNNRH
jgi:drug/metabolite transporter (DMT)-like permease